MTGARDRVDPNTPGLPVIPDPTGTMGTRGANRDAMVQHLEDDTWVDTLISEAYADAWAGRTSAHHTRKHVNRRMKTLFHVGSDEDRPEGFDTATLFSLTTQGRVCQAVAGEAGAR